MMMVVVVMVMVMVVMVVTMVIVMMVVMMMMMMVVMVVTMVMMVMVMVVMVVMMVVVMVVTMMLLCVVAAVFHGFGGRMTVSDVGPTTVNNIMAQCFKEIGLKKRDLNGQTPFGQFCRSNRVIRPRDRDEGAKYRVHVCLSVHSHNSKPHV